MSVDYGDLVDYPIRGSDPLSVFLVMTGPPVVLGIFGVVVALLSFLIPFVGIVNLLLYPLAMAVGVLWLGYFVRVVRSTYRGESDPPRLGEWGPLLKDGLFGAGIYLVYLLPLFALAVVGVVAVVGLLGGIGAVGGESAGAALGLLGLLLMLVLSALYFAYVVVMGYLFPISLCSYADTGEVSDAFSVERMRRVGLNADYAVPWVLVAGAAFLVQSVVQLLSVVLVGYLLVPLLPVVFFYLGVASFYAFAQVYDEAVPASAADPAAEAPGSTGTGAGRSG